MGQDSKIEWTHHTFNPWRGCTKVSDGCKNCYAAVNMSVKLHGITWGPNGDRIVKADSGWKEPLAWDRAAAVAGERHRVFCASLADVFEGPETMPAASLPAVRAARVRLFDLIRLTPNLDWLVLTKRPQNWRTVVEESLILCQGGDADDVNYFSDHDGDFPKGDLANWLNDWSGGEPPANVWLGTSVENQQTADERIPHLLKCPAAVRFLSCEPLLGPVDPSKIPFKDGSGSTNALTGNLRMRCRGVGGHPDLEAETNDPALKLPSIHWAIAGGESGPNARPMHPDWARSIRDQCAAAGVPFFFKQWGEFSPVRGDRGLPFIKINSGVTMDAPTPMYRVGKKAAGRLLGGRTWDEFPEVTQ